MSAQPEGLTAPAFGAVGQPGAVVLAGPTVSQGAENLHDHLIRLGPVPAMTCEELANLVEDADLVGRGGGQFPFARKLRAVVHASSQKQLEPLVIVNAAESEPASRKDHIVLAQRPHLVLDGAAIVARALGARTAVIYVHRDFVVQRRLAAALRERCAARLADPVWSVAAAPNRYVAGESSAVVSFVSGGSARPTTTRVPAAVAGVNGRPTLVSNAETFAHVGLMSRTGAPDWRSSGPDGKGPRLVTLHGGVREPGLVVEVNSPVTIGTLLRDVGDVHDMPAAVLIGGYAGTWLPGPLAWRTPISAAALTNIGASLGCGLIGVLPHDRCGLAETARLVTWLAAEGAGQCGPCIFGLPHLASVFERVGRHHASARAVRELRRVALQVDRRGACGHPDGVVRLMRSALDVFESHIGRRTGRRCPGVSRSALFPLPHTNRDEWV